MRKNLLFVCFIFSMFCYGQNNITRNGLALSQIAEKSPEPSSQPTLERKKGTIIFKEEGKSKDVFSTKTSGVCGIFMFENVSEAVEFATKLKNTYQDITDFSYSGVKNNIYYFNYSLSSPKSKEWYYAILTQNGISIIEYNGKSQVIN